MNTIIIILKAVTVAWLAWLCLIAFGPRHERPLSRDYVGSQEWTKEGE